MHAEQLRQRNYVGEKKVEGDCHDNAQQDGECCQKVQGQPPALKGGEEGRTDLKPDEEDKENKPEVTQEIHDGRVDGDAEVAHGQSRKKDEGDAEGYSQDLDASQSHSYGDDKGVDKKNMAYRICIGEKLFNPHMKNRQQGCVGGRPCSRLFVEAII